MTISQQAKLFYNNIKGWDLSLSIFYFILYPLPFSSITCMRLTHQSLPSPTIRLQQEPSFTLSLDTWYLQNSETQMFYSLASFYEMIEQDSCI